MKMMKKLLKGYRSLTLLIKKLSNFSWIDIFGVSVFFFILMFGLLFLLRRTDYLMVTIRLLEKDAPDFYFNLPRQWFVENIKPGIKETDQFGRSVVEIIDVYRYPSGNVMHDVYLTLKIKTVFNKMTGQHTYNGSPLLIGGFRAFRLQNILLNGVIVSLGKENMRTEKKSFLVETFLSPVDHESSTSFLNNKGYEVDGIKNYLANEIIPGLQIVDSNKEVIAEVISVNKSPGTISYINNHNLLKVNDPERIRVEITFKLLAEQINDSFYFQKFGSLMVGNTLSLTFENITIRPTIISVKPM